MLDRNQKHRSRYFQETQAFLADKGLQSRVLGKSASNIDKAFDAKVNAVYGSNVYIAYMEYGADVEIDAPADRQDYGFSIPLGGAMASSTGQDMVACTASQTILASPGRDQRLFLAGDAQRLALSVQQNLVRQRLSALTGEVVDGVVEFDPILDVTGGAGRMITSNMHLIVAEQERGTDVFADRLRECHFEETVLSTLLLYHGHSHQMLLERPMGAPASRDVKLTIDYIHANLTEPLTLEDLVAIAGVPGRTLNEHFRLFTGYAPMAYLRRLRLQAVRRSLMSDAALSVTVEAMRFGFMHMGRFSEAYRNAFGETPSETLKRTRKIYAVGEMTAAFNKPNQTPSAEFPPAVPQTANAVFDAEN